MAKAPPALLAWASYFIMFAAAVTLLGSISASQRYCGRSSANSLTISGAGAYFAPIPCDKFYRYTWWIVWYEIAMAVVVPIVLAQGKVHQWRYGLIGLLVPLTYLLMQTAYEFPTWICSFLFPSACGNSSVNFSCLQPCRNAFFIQKLNLTQNRAASRAMLAGAIMGAIANYFLIILFGVRDENPSSQVEEK